LAHRKANEEFLVLNWPDFLFVGDSRFILLTQATFPQLTMPFGLLVYGVEKNPTKTRRLLKRLRRVLPPMSHHCPVE
jgi:hypothetical protein